MVDRMSRRRAGGRTGTLGSAGCPRRRRANRVRRPAAVSARSWVCRLGGCGGGCRVGQEFDGAGLELKEVVYFFFVWSMMTGTSLPFMSAILKLVDSISSTFQPFF